MSDTIPEEKQKEALGDQIAREQIKSLLERNLLVEAAAGTGKTTGMMERMVALLTAGKCRTGTLAAVTFTRKAAAELRSRFQVALEKAAAGMEGEAGENARVALEEIDRAFIGTIHSFCARLLRERPVEAGVDLEFTEIEEDDDELLRSEAWQIYVAGLIADDPGEVLPELERLGLNLDELETAFIRFTDYPDAGEWPADCDTGPTFAGEARDAELYSAHMFAQKKKLPGDAATDKLIPHYKRIPRVVSHLPDLDQPGELYDLMCMFDTDPRLVQKVWEATGNYSRDDAKSEKAKWDTFRNDKAAPVLQAWREARYPAVLQVFHDAGIIYDRMRRERGVLNFADLLTSAAALLRGNPHIREYFQRRFTHLLVDEFQDTDPIQAEVMLLLTSSDPAVTDYRNCVPKPGSLFVVGDPKQSIYRFRRADIEVYNEVKRIIEDTGGLVLQLYSNFRSTGEILSWVNDVFSPSGDGEKKAPADGGAMLEFPEEATPQSPAYIPLERGTGAGKDGDLHGIYEIVIPEEQGKRELAVEYEAGLLARTIRAAVDGGMTVTRTAREFEKGADARLGFSDFLIITRNKADLGRYAAKLDALGVPNQVTGGASVSDVPELKMLHLFLEAVLKPDDPVALIASLRSELFGVSDVCLYTYKKAGGAFNYRAALPAELEATCAAAMSGAFRLFKDAAATLAHLPPAAAIDKTADMLGLNAGAGARPGADVAVGSIKKAIEILRSAPASMRGVTGMVEYLGEIAEGTAAFDGISAASSEKPAVRIMNLHKAKGLEAPVVFLANTYGESNRDPDLHIERGEDGDIVSGQSCPDPGRGSRGYILVQKKINEYRFETIAQPPGWAEVMEREKEFRKAEELRLRYVAATRAGAALIITRKTKRDQYNPWQHFKNYLQAAKAMPDPGEVKAPVTEIITVTPEEIQEAQRSIESRLSGTFEPTYDVQRAKEYALATAARGREPDKTGAATGGEHGMEWGTVIHLLLELAMNDPKADLESAARIALEENGLDMTLAGEAVQTVRSVMGSDIWKRAEKAEKVMTEVPFEILLDPDADKPTILRGAIDLAFKEADGWVVIDYKTDSLDKNTPEELRAKYAPQLEIYKQAWESATNEKVAEIELLIIG